jgi:hypothetical protein
MSSGVKRTIFTAFRYNFSLLFWAQAIKSSVIDACRRLTVNVHSNTLKSNQHINVIFRIVFLDSKPFALKDPMWSSFTLWDDSAEYSEIIFLGDHLGNQASSIVVARPPPPSE